MAEPSWRELNRAMWDEKLPLHLKSPLYDLDAFKAGALSLKAHEVEDLGDVAGKDLIHLQCHFGKDTLSWARLGARVTGVDFSAPAIEAARLLAAEIGVAARFVTSDVYDAPAAVDTRPSTSSIPGSGRSAGCRTWIDGQRSYSSCCGPAASFTCSSFTSARRGGDGAGLGRNAGAVPARTGWRRFAPMGDDGQRRRWAVPHAARHALAAADVCFAGAAGRLRALCKRDRCGAADALA